MVLPGGCRREIFIDSIDRRGNGEGFWHGRSIRREGSPKDKVSSNGETSRGTCTNARRAAAMATMGMHACRDLGMEMMSMGEPEVRVTSRDR